jgi:hypothetical protein
VPSQSLTLTLTFHHDLVDLAKKMLPDETGLELDAEHVIRKVSTSSSRICGHQSEMMPPCPSILARNSYGLKAFT